MVGLDAPRSEHFCFLLSNIVKFDIICKKKNKSAKMVGLDAPKRHLKSSRRPKQGSQEAPDKMMSSNCPSEQAPREAQISPESLREAQRRTESPREALRGLERPREVERG